MTKRFWAGLDVGVETTSLCVIDDRGEILREAVCPTKVKDVHQELAFMKRRRFSKVGLEAGVGTTLARGLRNLGYSVDIYEARQLSKFLRLRRNKTDAGDAFGIAQAGRLATPIVSKVHLKTFECQSLASRLAIRRHLIGARIRAVNQLCRQIESFGGRVRPCRTAKELHSAAEVQIREIFGRDPNALVMEFRYLLSQCEDLFHHQQCVDRELRRVALENDVCCRFMQIPGVGPICALTFYTAVGEPCRFRKSASVGSYLGLTPRLFESGLTHRMGRISKMGHKATRSLLVQASAQFMRRSGEDLELHAWASRIEGRRGRGRSRVALARKLAIVMLAMWKNGANFQPKLVQAL